MAKKIISFVIPVWNERDNIPLIYDRLRTVFADLKEKYDYEIIFIDDGSHDDSQEIAERLAEKDYSVKYLQFSRNFGKEIALSAGLRNITGDAVILLDADLQHPPEYVPKFIEKWENGADVVIGVREKYDSGGFIRKLCSAIFYKLQNSILDVKLRADETDYRLLDRRVAAEYNKFTERGRIFRGLVNWLGFKKDYVSFVCHCRQAGKSGFNFLRLTKLAVSCFVSQSLFPLKFAGYLGVIITPLAGAMGIFIFIEKYLLGDRFSYNFSGTAMLAVLVIFLVGIILMCLGLIALYIANIQVEVMNRPMYVVRRSKNLSERGQNGQNSLV